MSSTNVHSEEQIENICCAGAQIIATEKEVEIPPKSAKKGPSVIEVKVDEGIEIQVGESELNKDGQLITKSGTVITTFSKEAMKEMNKNRKSRDKMKDKAKANGAEIGE